MIVVVAVPRRRHHNDDAALALASSVSYLFLLKLSFWGEEGGTFLDDACVVRVRVLVRVVVVVLE